jgi:hypothetical protein
MNRDRSTSIHGMAPENAKSLFATLAICAAVANASTWYIAPAGNDNAAGTKSAPFRSFRRAQKSVAAGDTVYIRGGTYTVSESDIDGRDSLYDSRITGYRYWAYMNEMGKSGSSGKPIRYWAYPGERPVFDFTNVRFVNYRILGFHVTGSWLHFRGFDVVGIQVNTVINSQSECFHNEGSHNLYENLAMHDGMGIGFYLTGGSNNLVLNCDAYRNFDGYSGDGKGGNVDGFGIHPGSTSDTGNVVRNCRAWFNSDDGYDCITASAGVLFDSCWAMWNGYTPDFTSRGDGNGLKVGGYGAHPAISALPNPIPSHTARFCIAFSNKRDGIIANHHVKVGNHYYNNLSWNNGIANYSMLSQKIVQASDSTDSATQDVPGFSHILKNNVSLTTSRGADTAFFGSALDLSYNTFGPAYTWKVAASDFLSVDTTLFTAPRDSLGRIPSTLLLRIAAGSHMIDAGKNVGFAYQGKAPDLGPFESGNPSDVAPRSSRPWLVPPQDALLFDLSGHRVDRRSRGIRIARWKGEDGTPLEATTLVP